MELIMLSGKQQAKLIDLCSEFAGTPLNKGMKDAVASLATQKTGEVLLSGQHGFGTKLVKDNDHLYFRLSLMDKHRQTDFDALVTVNRRLKAVLKGTTLKAEEPPKVETTPPEV